MADFDFARQLIAWQSEHGRHDLPWQQPATPYRVWLSEVMLQQTQVATVIPYFNGFIASFPDINSLARAPLDAVLAKWSGLGYYSRARNLHRSAQICNTEHEGLLPDNFDELLELPGIGRSTAGAIMALAYGKAFPILDGNARRVLARFHAIGGSTANAETRRRLWAAAGQHTPSTDVSRYTQAIMDLGARICTRSNPQCRICPLQFGCRAYRAGKPHAFPEQRRGGQRPQRKAVMLILRNDSGEVLLQRRPPAGVWGGLWSLPEFSPTENLNRAARNKLGVNPIITQWLSPLRHQFTHFTLDILPVSALAGVGADSIKEHADLRWHSLETLTAIGLPAPVRKLLKQEFGTCPEQSTA